MKKEITYDALLEKIPNKYILTIVSGKRARELAKEKSQKLSENILYRKYDKKDTDMKIVFNQILDGKIGYED